MSALIGISGGSGSGKTYLLHQLLQLFNANEICALSMDHYYRPKEMLTRDENNMVNFDLPSCIDHERLSKDINELLEGRKVSIKEYTFNNPSKKPVIIELHPAPVIILEGIFSFHFPEITQMLDLKIFIECDEQLRLARRLERDTNERSYLKEDIHYQWKKHVQPAHLLYLEPQYQIADIVIDGNSPEGAKEAYKAIQKIKKHKE